ncbi:MAG: ABC transporter permease [Clostridia bacterium]|nr:ABC transporter permease [Clostridia bacterium]
MYMLKYALKRLGLMLLTFIIIFTICFTLVKLLPNEPLPSSTGDYALLQQRRDLLGFDKSIPEQHLIYLFGRQSYTYDDMDEDGNKIQAIDDKNQLVFVTKIKYDAEGNIIYKRDKDGNYLDAEGRIALKKSDYVPETEFVLDEQGNPIPVWQRKVVYEKKDIPANADNLVQKWAGGIIRGEFGACETQIAFGRDVWKVFVEKVPFTVSLNLWSILVSIPLGIALGIYAALKKNKWQDHVISTAVMVCVSVPSFIYAFLVQYAFFKLQKGSALPIAIAVDGAWSWTFIKSIIPAILSMSFGSIAGFARYTRAELTEVLTSEFMLLARTKGLSKAQAVVRHALKNAMVVIFPMIMGEFISIMSGSLIIEQLFSIPGVGKLYMSSVQASPTPDYNFFMLLTGFYTLIGLTAGIVVDISYGIIDPRIRMGAR